MRDLGSWNRNLAKWSDGELFWLGRRLNNWTQARQARALRIPVKQLISIEMDVLAPPQGISLPAPAPSLGDLCALARRRKGLGLHGTAALVSCSHTTLLAQERASSPELVAKWRGYGYRFPRKTGDI